MKRTPMTEVPEVFKAAPSVVERVVRHTPCPVLVVREKEHDFISLQPEKAESEHAAAANGRKENQKVLEAV